MTEAKRFCDIVRKRSIENQSAVELLYAGGLTGQIISVLRQELDSMVRAIFLLTIDDLSVRHELIRQTLSGEKWKIGKAQVTDRQMVDVANSLYGWTQSVYKFGCGFIHLSVLHDYATEDPFANLGTTEVNDIKRHLNNYHDFPLISPLTISTIQPYLPKVCNKISSNLESYLQSLESEQIGLRHSL